MTEDYRDKFKYVIFHSIFSINKPKDSRDYHPIDWMFNVNHRHTGYPIKEFLEFNLPKKYGYLARMGDLDEHEAPVAVRLKSIDALRYILNAEPFKNLKYYYSHDRDLEENPIPKTELIREATYYLNQAIQRYR